MEVFDEVQGDFYTPVRHGIILALKATPKLGRFLRYSQKSMLRVEVHASDGVGGGAEIRLCIPK